MSNVLYVDDYDLSGGVQIASDFGSERFGYLVTPNVDHVIRYYYDAHFREVYEHAAYVLMDSRFLAHALGILKGQAFRVCVGSDLTEELMCKVLRPTDKAVLVGGSAEQAAMLSERFGLNALRHIDPPMNFIANADAVEACLSAIESASPFRFCFLAVGSPQQEFLALKLKERGGARGLALCIGAGINYLTGKEKRAPQWMRSIGCEWLFRLMSNPTRMAKRYLVRGPIIFFLLWRVELRLRLRPPPAMGELKKPAPQLTVPLAG